MPYIYIELHLTSKSEILVIIIVKTPSGKMSTYVTPEDVSILWNILTSSGVAYVYYGIQNFKLTGYLVI